MTVLSFDQDGVDVIYESTEFRMERPLIEDATGEDFESVTDHEVLKLIEPDPELTGEPRRIGDILRAKNSTN
jgi:hypothetical protein